MKNLRICNVTQIEIITEEENITIPPSYELDINHKTPCEICNKIHKRYILKGIKKK